MSTQPSISKTIWRFVKPELEELVIYVLAIIGFGIIAGIGAVTASAATSLENNSTALSYIEDKFLFLTDGDDLLAKIFTFGLWFIIGTVVYTIAWFIINFSSGAFKKMEVSSSYLHPHTFNRSKFWKATLARVILQASAAVTLLLYVAFWCAAVAPAWLGSFRAVFLYGVTAETAQDALIALIGIGLSLHIATILLRLMLLRARYSYQR